MKINHNHVNIFYMNENYYIDKNYLDSEQFKKNFEKLVNFFQGKRVILFGKDDIDFIKSKCDLSRINFLGIYDPDFSSDMVNDNYKGYKILSKTLVELLNPDYILDMCLYKYKFITNYNDNKIEMKNFLSFFSDVDKPQIPYIETNITNHCNLNCKYCFSFSPLVSEDFADLEQYKKDISELSKKVDIYVIRLLGGEPLLNKRINEFIEVTRKGFPCANIAILTNGILLPAMKEDFWKCCIDNNIRIDISLYPGVSDKHQEYIDVLKKYNLLGDVHKVTTFINLALSEAQVNDDIEDIYEKCRIKLCKSLRNGKLYNCKINSCVHYFNNYFNKNVPQKDGIDIYKNDGKSILKKLHEKIELCKYCNIEKRKVHTWSLTNKEISEWFQ